MQISLVKNKSLLVACEYIDWNLQQYSNSNTLEPGEICLIMFQITKGIEFLQKNHIVHRDLKADNILIDTHGRTLISDFGSAIRFKPEQKLTYHFKKETDSRGGTPNSLPPEIRNQKSGSDVFLDYSTCDSYALGILIYGLLRIQLSESGQHPLIPNFSTGLQDLVQGLIEKDPGKRM